MEVEIISKKENLMIGRLEVNFKVSHPKKITPNRQEVREEIASLLKIKKDRLVIDNMKPEFGKPETVGYAKVYKSKDDVLQMETKAVLKRNNLFEEKKEKKEEKKEGA
ncbi:MAG: 30S ribosomal protein S24e [Thermoplasmata archaeon]